MEPIPQPHILDPNRILDPRRDDFTTDHESRARMYEDGLHESCAYAQQLWQALDGVREYLMASLPPDPRAPDAHVTCASPTGPDDDEGWTRWIDMFSVVTSVMCGPHGDSGFGYGQARAAAQLRREIPAVAESDEAHDKSADGKAEPSEPEAPSEPQAPSEPPANRSGSKRMRVAAGAVLGLLAVRGLLPRHRSNGDSS